MILSTTDTIQGREIAEYLGIVSAFGFLFGGNTRMKTVQNLFSKDMTEVKEKLISAASETGADAVVGIRFSFVDSHIYVTGTAVKLKD